MFLEITDDGDLGKDIRQTRDLLRTNVNGDVENLGFGIFALMADGMVRVPTLNSPTALFIVDNEVLEMMRNETKTDMKAVSDQMLAAQFGRTGSRAPEAMSDFIEGVMSKGVSFVDGDVPTFRGVRIKVLNDD
jgi:hypothetical protein